jgi:hypothetical protein
VVDEDAGATVSREQLSAGTVWLVRGIAISALALPLVLLEAPWSYAAPVVGPLGAGAVYLGIRDVVRATPASPVAGLLVALAAMAVPLRIGAEVGPIVTAPGPVAGQAALTATDTSLGTWDVVALFTLGVTFIGVVVLAQHLRTVLVGIAGDRWRQVFFAWVVATVSLPLALLTGAVELVLLAAAVVVTAGALLLLSLLATYRAAEDDDLDAEFPER